MTKDDAFSIQFDDTGEGVPFWNLYVYGWAVGRRYSRTSANDWLRAFKYRYRSAGKEYILQQFRLPTH